MPPPRLPNSETTLVDVLYHDPEGDRNPYEVVPWARSPLNPSSSDVVSIGVRADTSVASIVLEWRSAEQSHSVAMDNTDNVWTATVGPFGESGEYRFVASRPRPGQDAATEWFPLPIASWEAVSLTSVAGDSGGFEVTGDGAVLTLEPDGGDTVDWRLTSGANSGGAGRVATCGDWEAAVRSGSLLLSRGNGFSIEISIAVRTVGGSPIAWRLSWSIDPAERIFGTGERFDAVDQRGKTPDIRVYEQYKDQGARTYFPLPWLWSTRGYGLAVHGGSRVAFDLGVSDSDVASATMPGASEVSGRWYFGEPRTMLQAYVADSGLPSALPMWAYGPWMSGNEWDSDQRVREVVERSTSDGIPASVIVIEAWADEVTFYLFNGAEYDVVDGESAVPFESMRFGAAWPDPKGLVDWLHEKGIRVLLWQIPLLKDVTDHAQHGADLQYVREAGLAVGTTDGAEYRNRGWWFPKSRVIDFTNPQARDWWFNKRAYLLDEIGVDGFKTDGGEHLWGSDVVTASGETGDVAANAYPTHYLSAYHSFLREHGHENPVTFSRAGSMGSLAFPAHWAGDEDSTWEAFRASLTAGLSAAASGIAFWGWDLAGFSGALPTADLYIRSTAMAAFCPIMQYHSEHNEHRQPLADRTPWNVAAHTETPEVVDAYRFYARLRMNLVPYLLGLGIEAAKIGTPVMRPLALECSGDAEAAGVDDQFFLGPDVLVAPVVNPAATHRRLYLPDGDWYNFWSGERVGSGWLEVALESYLIPVFVRAGSCIPLWMPEIVQLGAKVELPHVDSGRLVLMVFPGSRRSSGVDPLTMTNWTIQLSTENDTSTVVAEGIPEGTVMWMRRPALLGSAEEVSEHRLVAGSSVTTVDMSPDAT